MATSARPAAGGSATASVFATITSDKLKEILSKAITEDGRINKRFIMGDHWQDGAGWIGPMPKEGTQGRDEMVDLIRSRFVSRNVIKEICRRHAGGVVGREPSWTFTPLRKVTDEEPLNDQEKADIATVHAWLTEWWNRRKVAALILAATKQLAWAGRSPARIFVPRGMMSETEGATGTVSAANIRDGLAKLFVDMLDFEVATVHIDPDTREELGVFAYTPEGATRTTYYLTYLQPGGMIGETPDKDQPRLTIMAVLETGAVEESTPLDIGGRLTMFEMRRDPLISPQVVQQQRAVNFASTLSPRTLETAGFLERIIINAQINGEEREVNGRKVFVPDVPTFGAGVTTFLEGATVEGRQEEKTMSPSVVYRPPTPVTPIIEGKEAHYQDALEEADQSHVLLAGMATPSGKSREEARADFYGSLLDSHAPVTDFVRWLLETALAFAEALANKPGLYSKRYRADVRLRLSAGKPNVDERAQTVAEVEHGIRSRETAMEDVDIADADAERTRIESDPVTKYGIITKLGEAIAALTQAGATFEGACTYLGLTADEIAELSTSPDDESGDDTLPPGGGDVDDDEDEDEDEDDPAAE